MLRNPSRFGAAIVLTTCLGLITSFASVARGQDQNFYRFLEDFATTSSELHIPAFDYNYQANFAAIQDSEGLAKQEQFYLNARDHLRTVARHSLEVQARVLYDVLNYELRFNLDRIALERDFKASGAAIPQQGLHELPRHREWYALYSKRWASVQVGVAQLMDLSRKEVAEISWHMRQIQIQLGYGDKDQEFYQHLTEDQFFLSNVDDVKQGYARRHATVSAAMPELFGHETIAPLDIVEAPGTDANSPPGYYTDNTFYFNFFGQRHSIRTMDWLYMHEAIPGHHFHYASSSRSPNPAPNFRALFWYPGHAEGWGAYIEKFGMQLGLYQDLYAEYGKWEWDLVRSVRVAIDYGIHYFGWTRDEAAAHWRRHIPNRDDIMDRELTRIRDWPGQVLSYKVGEAHINTLRQMVEASQGTQFSLPNFHKKIVEHGTLPLLTLQRLILDD